MFNEFGKKLPTPDFSSAFNSDIIKNFELRHTEWENKITTNEAMQETMVFTASMCIAYKKNVDDMRESPSVEIMSQLQQLGAHIDYSDPHVPVFPKMRRYHFDLRSVDITFENIKTYDCVILATDHEIFNYKLIAKHAQMIVDSRGKFNVELANVFAA